jgi:hypothetical protein
LTAVVVLILGVQGVDRIPQEVRFLLTRMSEERFRFAEVERQGLL